MPQLGPPGGAIAGHRRPGNRSVEETLLAVCRASISVRSAEGIAEALWGGGLSLTEVSETCRKLEIQIETWLNKALRNRCPYLFLEEVRLKQRHLREPRRIGLLLAVGVNAQGFREVLGASEGREGDAASWRRFLGGLKDRGLNGVKLCVCPWPSPLIEIVGEHFGAAACQYSVEQFCRAVLAAVPPFHLPAATELLKHIHECETPDQARGRVQRAAARLRTLKLREAAALLEQASDHTLRFFSAPREHWRAVRSNESRRRVAREIRESTLALGSPAEADTAVLFAGARLRQITRTSWGRHRCLAMGGSPP